MQEKKHNKALLSNLKNHLLLQEYVQLLNIWSKKINLLSHDDTYNLNLIWERHVYNSYQLKYFIDLAVGNFNTSNFIYDLGSGAGLPGIVLAILDNSDNHYYLVEKNYKKSSFLIFAKRQLQLNNVTILNVDITTLKHNIADIVIARALTSLVNLFTYTQKLLKYDGNAFFLKGTNYKNELYALEKIIDINLYKLQVHKIDENSTNVIQLTRI